MKTMKCAIFACALFGAAGTGNATVTLLVGSSGWGDHEAVVGGLAWGIVVDSDGNSVNGDFGESFLEELAVALDGFSLPETAVFSDPVPLFDEYYFVPARDTTRTASLGDTPIEGYMGDLGLRYSAPVGPGDDYGLIWFSKGSGTLSESDYFGFRSLGGVAGRWRDPDRS